MSNTVAEAIMVVILIDWKTMQPSGIRNSKRGLRPDNPSTTAKKLNNSNNPLTNTTQMDLPGLSIFIYKKNQLPGLMVDVGLSFGLGI